MKCEICGQPKENDLYSAVTGEPVCSICRIKFVRGFASMAEKIKDARKRLGLKDGEYLKQDHSKEASRILGR